jgi:transcription antitermination factor NusG
MNQNLAPEDKWYAIYTRSRHEKKVAANLQERRIEVFLPLRTMVSRWKDRRKEVQWPLFTSYLFVRIPPAMKVPVLQTAGVAHFVCSNRGMISPIPDDQIEAIRTLIASGLKYDPYPYLKEGMTVRVRRGPLKGVEGILIGKKKKHLLVLSVDLIQQSTALEIDISDTDVR